MSKNILVYSSIGDISTFFPLWKHKDLHYAFNYYGRDEERKKRVEGECNYFTCGPGTKFNLFSKLYSSLPEYDYYVLIDDDINLKGDDILKIVDAMEQRGCGVASPSHSPQGHISWPIMKTVEGSDIREAVFVEMTVVVFSRAELKIFLDAYTPYNDQMVGWGIDYIIHSVCTKPFLIFDNISVTNPTNQQKGIAKREIQEYLGNTNPAAMWHKVLMNPNNNFVEYKKV